MTFEARNRSRAQKRAAMRRRLIALWDEIRAADLASGISWYDRAQNAAQSLAEGTSLDARQCAGIIAALSPRQRWSVNVAQAARVVEAATNGDRCPAVSTTNNRGKAWAIANGADPDSELSGPKVRAFFANITGDHSQVTIDAWAIRAAEGEWRDWQTNSTNGERKVSAPVGHRYTDAADAYRQAAQIVGISPRDFQAAVWIHVRGASD